MANQYGRQFIFTKEPAVWKLFGYVTFGSTGAPILVAGRNKGIQSITRNSAGNYTVKLTDSYVGFLHFSANMIVATGDPAAPFLHMVSESVATSGTQSIIFQYLAVDGTTATDPASGEALSFEITLKNSAAY
jgi:hypothetical protein